jgi:hypothetical protein
MVAWVGREIDTIYKNFQKVKTTKEHNVSSDNLADICCDCSEIIHLAWALASTDLPGAMIGVDDDYMASVGGK